MLLLTLFFLFCVCMCVWCLIEQEGQESSIAYSKCKADIYNMGLDREALEEKINSAPNTGGFGGLRGLFGERWSNKSKIMRYPCAHPWINSMLRI